MMTRWNRGDLQDQCSLCIVTAKMRTHFLNGLARSFPAFKQTCPEKQKGVINKGIIDLEGPRSHLIQPSDEESKGRVTIHTDSQRTKTQTLTVSASCSSYPKQAPSAVHQLCFLNPWLWLGKERCMIILFPTQSVKLIRVAGIVMLRAHRNKASNSIGIIKLLQTVVQNGKRNLCLQTSPCVFFPHTLEPVAKHQCSLPLDKSIIKQPAHDDQCCARHWQSTTSQNREN